VNTPSTSSTSEPNWPEKARGSPDWVEKLRRHKEIPWRERPISLKYKDAICRQFKYGLTNKEIADEIGVSVTAYSQKKNSNEGKALRKELEEFRKDDKRLVESRFHDEAFNTYQDLIDSRDALSAAGLHKDAAKIDLKLLEMFGFDVAKQKAAGAGGDIQVVIQIGDRTIEDFMSSPLDVVETSYEVIDTDTTRHPALPAGGRNLAETPSSRTD
jgi:AraC-like DNA-binding protein